MPDFATLTAISLCTYTKKKKKKTPPLILLKNCAVRTMSGLFIGQVSGQTECAVVTYGKDSWNVKSVHKWHRLL